MRDDWLDGVNLDPFRYLRAADVVTTLDVARVNVNTRQR